MGPKRHIPNVFILMDLLHLFAHDHHKLKYFQQLPDMQENVAATPSEGVKCLNKRSLAYQLSTGIVIVGTKLPTPTSSNLFSKT